MYFETYPFFSTLVIILFEDDRMIKRSRTRRNRRGGGCPCSAGKMFGGKRTKRFTRNRMHRHLR